MIQLPPLEGPEALAWSFLLDLAATTHERWTLVGGLMVRLHCYEVGVTPSRQTADVDVLVDISMARHRSLERLSRLLVEEFDMTPSPSTGTVTHRFTKTGLAVDLLAPDHYEGRELTTVPPGRTVAVPGGRAVLRDSEAVEVALAERRGAIERPPLARAIIAKWRAYAELRVQAYRDRHLVDVATLLSLVSDPVDTRAAMTRTDRQRAAALRDGLVAMTATWAAEVDDPTRVIDTAYALAGPEPARGR